MLADLTCVHLSVCRRQPCMCVSVCMQEDMCLHLYHLLLHRQIHKAFELLSLFINLAHIPHLMNTAVFLSSCSLLFPCSGFMCDISHLQPYAANLIHETGPCLKRLCAVAAKSALSGIKSTIYSICPAHAGEPSVLSFWDTIRKQVG